MDAKATAREVEAVKLAARTRAALARPAPSHTLVDPSAMPGTGAKAVHGPGRCITWAGLRYCGPTVRARLRVAPCRIAAVDAIITRLPPEIRAGVVLGRDYLAQAVERIDPDTGAITCRRRSRR